MEIEIILNDDLKVLFTCPSCKERIPYYELEEVDYILYIKFTCLCMNKSHMLLKDYIQNQIEYDTKIKAQCSVNDSHNKIAVVYSLKTKLYMCKDCETVSKKLNRDDILLNQALDIDIYCKYHFSKQVSLYCSKCSKLICSKCIKTDHKGHENITFQMMYQELLKKKGESFYNKYIEKIEKKRQGLLKKDIAKQQLTEIIIESNKSNNKLLFQLIQMLFNTYETISNQPSQIIIDHLNQLTYYKDILIDKYEYIDYISYLKKSLLIQNIKTQYTIINSTLSHKGDIRCIVQLSNLNQLAVGFVDHLSIYDLKNIEYPLIIETISITNLATFIEVSIMNFNYLIIGCFDCIAAIDSSIQTISNIVSKKLIYNEGCTCIISLGDNKIAFGSNKTNTVVILDCEGIHKNDCKTTHIFKGHEDLIICLLYHDQSLYSSCENTLKVWNVHNGKEINIKEVKIEDTIRAMLMLDTNEIFIGEVNGTISLLSLPEYTIKCIIQKQNETTLCNLLLIYSNKYLIAAYQEYKIIYHVKQKNELKDNNMGIKLIPFYRIMDNTVDWCVSLITIQNDYFLSSNYQSFEIFCIPNNKKSNETTSFVSVSNLTKGTVKDDDNDEMIEIKPRKYNDI